MRKYIIIPTYAPLYAMSKCFGPTHGPLKKPVITPIDVIGELLHQVGGPEIFEVKKLADKDGKSTFSKPVKLTLDNYRLPYDEIAGITETSVKPEVMAEVVEDEPALESTVIEPAPESTTIEDAVPAKNVTVSISDGINVASDTHKHMTKAERRAARRAAAAANNMEEVNV